MADQCSDPGKCYILPRVGILMSLLLEISGDIRKLTLASLFVPMHAVLSIPLFEFSTGLDTYIPAHT